MSTEGVDGIRCCGRFPHCPCPVAPKVEEIVKRHLDVIDEEQCEHGVDLMEGCLDCQQSGPMTVA